MYTRESNLDVSTSRRLDVRTHQVLVIYTNTFYNNEIKQDCIPVRCVPPAH